MAESGRWRVKRQVSSLQWRKCPKLCNYLNDRIVTKKSVHSVLNERNILIKLKNHFIVNMNCAFQDRENIYLVVDYMQGGDLRYHLGKIRKFSEEQASIFYKKSVYYSLHFGWVGVFTWKSYYSSRYQAWKLSSGQKRNYKNHRSRNCKALQTWKLLRHQWDSWLHGPRGYVQAKPQLLCWFLRSWHNSSWTNDGKASLLRSEPCGNSGLDISKTGADKKARNTRWMVDRIRRFYQ